MFNYYESKYTVSSARADCDSLGDAGSWVN
jgi:hypothetical protein